MGELVIYCGARGQLEYGGERLIPGEVYEIPACVLARYPGLFRLYRSDSRQPVLLDRREPEPEPPTRPCEKKAKPKKRSSRKRGKK